MSVDFRMLRGNGRTAARAVFSVCVAAGIATVALPGPSVAGHGAVSYENAIKAAERKKREQQAAEAPVPAPAPAASPATAPAVAPAPTAAEVAATPAGSRDHAFAIATRRHLSEVIRMSEDEIANGTDPTLKALAKSLGESHRRQVAEIDRWLEAHPATAVK